MKRQIVIDGKTYEVEYDAPENHAQSIVLPTPQVPDSSGTTGIDESKVCRSPVAGIVSRINVESGRAMQSGDIILVVDAMKMENNLVAANAAKVKSVKVQVGDAVKVGQVVVEFE